jgi:murein DD-endopeptidase MepM/ murein hydrolase activator NlpD
MRKKHSAKARKKRTIAAAVAGFFRTRQIYIRSRSDVHYITFTPVMQLGLLLVLLAALFWMAYASVNIVFKDQLLELKQQKLFEARLDHEHELAAMRDAIEKANDRLLLNQQSYLRKLDEVKSRFDALSEQQDMVHDYFRKGWVPLRPASTDSQPAPEVEGNSVRFFQQRYAAEFRTEDEGLAPLSDMDAQMNGLKQRHLALIVDGVDYAQSRLARSSALMTRLGVSVPAEKQRTTDSSGGPFLPVGIDVSRFDTAIATAVSKLDGTLQRNNTVIAAVAAFPLGLPLRQIERISSEFGYRADPLRRTMSLHGGVDFVAEYGADVLATSSGRVIWAGRHGPYGNLVEIQHDNGVATRYGHLRGVNVALGQRVEAGAVIGWLGNTGRSTGPHLHYETRVNDRAIDPQKFWRTSNDLQTLKTNDKQQ